MRVSKYRGLRKTTPINRKTDTDSTIDEPSSPPDIKTVEGNIKGEEIESGIIKDYEYEDGDLDRSEDYWNKEIIRDDIDQMEQSLFNNLIIKAQEVEDLYAKLRESESKVLNTPIKSLQHITLPEALILFELLTKNLTIEDSLAITFQPQYADLRKISTVLSINNENIIINYNLSHKRSSIWLDKKKIGKVVYIIRNKRLEEIEGEYKNEKIMLDPIWIPGKGIKNERLKIGKIQADLITLKDAKQATLFNNKGKPSKLSINHIKSYRVAKNCFITYKTMRILHYKIEIKLLFNRLLPIPISGEVVIKNIKNKVSKFTNNISKSRKSHLNIKQLK